MTKSFEKHLVSIILTLVSITIGWLMTSSLDVVIAEQGTMPTSPEMFVTATILPSGTVRADDNMTSTALIVTNTSDINAPESDTTTSTTQVTLTTTLTSEVTSTPVSSSEPERDVRAPWEWSPRIGGGSGIGMRDVGGYVYINTTPWRCNGVLIDPEWVVTNAGCVTANRDNGSLMSTMTITVVAGCYSGNNCVKIRNPLWYGTQSQVVGVSRIFVYQPNPQVSDVDMTVALLKLSSPVVTGNGVNIVPLGMSSDTVVGQSGLMVMSYGDIITTSPTPQRGPEQLQRAPYSISADSACSDLNGYRDGMHHCGGTAPQVCKADWGAPITRIINGQPVLYGILASQTAFYGNGCPKNERSVGIDVTSDTIRQWIATTIRQGRTGVIADQDGLGSLGSALARGNNRQHVIDIGGVFPQGIRIGGVTNTKLSINENGVIALGSMTSGIPSYIDIAKWSGGKAPIIVVFGADGDTSGTAQRGVIGGTSSGSNQVWVTQDVSRRVVVITWDDIRPMSTNVTGARAIGNSYQVELRAQENGDIKVTMRYGVIGWTAGATQCGANCNGKYAQIGIADGRGKFQLGVPVVATSDVGLRQLTGKQLTFYLRDGVIYGVNKNPPVRREHNPIFIWTGTKDNIPVGWQRVTLLDGKFPRVVANGDRVLATGGSATHTHTSSPHTHSMLEHRHTTDYSPSVNTSTTRTRDSGSGTVSGHTHYSVTTSEPVDVSISAESAIYSAFSNNPPFYEVIFITKSDGAVTAVPPNAVALSKSALGALTLANGRNGTPNLQSRFIRGAPTNANAGAVGGFAKNTHTIEHTHTTSHDHHDQWAGADTTTSSTTRTYESGKPDNTLTSHTHMTYYDVATASTSGTSAISTPETVLPPYMDFVIGQNKTGRDLTQVGILALYTGSVDDLPQGWVVYTKIGRLIRGSNATGARGGSATHTHAASSHTHPDLAHTHTGTTSITNGTHDDGGDGRTSVRSHYHNISVSSVLMSFISAVTTANAANNMPEYVNVYLIEYTGSN